MKNRARNSQYLKSSNRWYILNLIRKQQLSRAELSRKTGLTRAAVTNIVDELIQEGMVIEKGTGEAEYGRKPVILDIADDRYYALGVYLSRTGCFLGVVNIKGEILMRKEIDICSADNAHEAIKIITSEIKKCINESNIPQNKLLGLGISAPGPLDVYSGTILDPPNFDMWKGVEIVKELKKDFSMGVFLENNSATLALAEKNYGIGKKFHSFMLLVVDSGIGAGIIIDDKLYKGRKGFGSEVGHISIDVHGRRCGCGNRGCLEVHASIPAILEEAWEDDKNIRTWSDIVDRALSGDPFYKGIIEKEALYLSTGIVNIMNVLELEAVILAGYIKYKPDILLEKVRSFANAACITRNIFAKKIYISSLPEDVDVVSAATIIIERFFNGELT